MSDGFVESLLFRIRHLAVRLGFDAVGFATATFLEKEARYLEKWLTRNAHGQMAYLENQFDLRADPRKVLPGTKTIISVIKNYYPALSDRLNPEGPKISAYAWGEDYHHVLKTRMGELVEAIREALGTDFQYKLCVDSAPIMDKVWAQRAGLGWIGKNTNLIRPKLGSFFFIGEVLIDVALPEGNPTADHCGTCTRCVDACPTQALKPYEIEADKCISYLTIELKDAIKSEFKNQLDGWAFGCDVCQTVCPWNRFSRPHSEPLFRPLDVWIEHTKADWLALSKSQFRKRTKRSAVSRISKQKFLNNVAAAENRFYPSLADTEIREQAIVASGITHDPSKPES